MVRDNVFGVDGGGGGRGGYERVRLVDSWTSAVLLACLAIVAALHFGFDATAPVVVATALNLV